MEPMEIQEEEAKKVAPIRVVNLASLQNIKVVKYDVAPRQNRRKSVHQVRSYSDEPIEFISLSNDGSSDSTTASTSKSAIPSTSKSAIASTSYSAIASTSKSIPVHRSQLKKKSPPLITDKETRPNDRLMKRVALLRVTTEYMLKELNIENARIGENPSLELLKSNYHQSMKKQSELEDSDIF